MERAKQLGKIDARCILEPAGNLIDHAGRVTYEQSKRNVDLFVVLSALRLDLRCLRSGEKRFVKHLLGELLLSLRCFRN